MFTCRFDDVFRDVSRASAGVNVLLVGLTMYFVLSYVHQQVLMKPNVSVLSVILQFA